MHFSVPGSVAVTMSPEMQALLGFAGSNRYGPHPNISGPVYAAEYNGYPDTVADLGAVGAEGGSPSHTVAKL